MEPQSKRIPAECALPNILATSETVTNNTASSSISLLKDTTPGKANYAVDYQTEIRTETHTIAAMKHVSPVCSPTGLSVGALVESFESKGTTDMPLSPVSTPDVSIMSDPFSFTTGSSFTSTSSSMVVAPQPLKSILKNAAQADLGSETGDDDDDSSDESDSDMLDAFDSDDEEDDEDDEDDDGTESEDSDDDISCDGSEVDDTEELEIEESFSFISFGNSVRFAESETVVIVSSTQDPAESNMTCHERMLFAKAPEHPNRFSSLNDKDYDPEEHSRDVLDLDKELLFAYINGLNTIDFDNYKSVLQSRTLNSTHGDVDFKPISGDTLTQLNEYFDRIVETLLGLFPNLFTEDEYNGILDQAKLGIKFDEVEQLLYCPESANVQQMLRDLLEQKLKNNTAVLEQEVLGWLAGELVEPLGRRSLSRQPGHTCDT